MNTVTTQFEITYEDVRGEWVPEDANVILEVTDPDPSITRYVVYAYDSDLYVLRFFTLGNHWVVSTDYAECIEDISELM